MKFGKKIFAVACIATLGTGIAFAAGCTPTGKTGEAYGLSHGGKYISRATVTLSADGKVTDASLVEVELPNSVTKKGTSTTSAADALSQTGVSGNNDYVIVETSAQATTNNVTTTTYTATAYYKTVKYGNVTMTFDATAKAYKIGDKTLVEYYYNNEPAAKAYYEAVLSNNISVVVGGQEKKDVMTNAELNKEVNGYWTKKDASGADYSRWLWNRDATINFVKANGVDGLASLTKSTNDEDKVDDGKGNKVTYFMSGNVSTGATWSDLYKATAPTTYYTYAQLLINAKNNVAK